MFYGIALLVIVGGIWTLTGIVMGGASRHEIETPLLQLISSAIQCVVCGILISAGVFPGLSISWTPALMALGMYFAVGVLNYVLMETMARAMERGPNGMVWAILQSGMILPFAAGILFHGVSAPATRLIGMAILLAALVLMSSAKNENEKNRYGKSWLILSFAAFLICGLQQTISNEPSYHESIRNGVPAVYRTLALGIGNFLPALPVCLLRKNGPGKKSLAAAFRRKLLWKYAVALQAFSLAAALFLTYNGMDRLAAAGIGAVSYPLMVVTCIVVFSFYSRIALREKLTLRSTAGILCCLTGIACICFEPSHGTEFPSEKMNCPGPEHAGFRTPHDQRTGES